MQIPGQTIAGGDIDYACSDAADAGKPGKRLGLTKAQRAGLDGLVESGEIVFGETEIDLTGGYLTEDGTVTLPTGDDSPLIKKNGNNGKGRGAGRSLLPDTGTRSVLAVRVIDVNGALGRAFGDESSKSSPKNPDERSPTTLFVNNCCPHSRPILDQSKHVRSRNKPP